MSHRRFTAEEEDNIISRYQAGESSVNIARDVLKTEHSATIINMLHRRGIKLRKSASALNPIVTDEMKCGIIDMCRDTRRYAPAMKKFGVSRETVRQTLREAEIALGVPIYHNRALTTDQEKEVVSRFKEGEMTRILAKDFDIDRKTVNEIIRRYGGKAKRKKFASHEDWLENPTVRLRKLLQTARANARKHDRPFDMALFDIFPINPPRLCACCGSELDYKVYPRNKMAHSRAPSFDRCENDRGYVVGNVYVICFRCNRLKNDATLAELDLLSIYGRHHLCNR